jgi:peptide-methionine (S)-S-oxide reductase
MRTRQTSPTRRWFVGVLCSAVAILAGCATPEPPNAPPMREVNIMNQEPDPMTEVPEGREIATVANGCFWCTEAIFTELKGVEKVVSGYSGGQVANPTYRAVCEGTTGHAEAIRIVFDPKVISFRELLEVFFTTHDPTTLNRQGNDVGTQYRSAIFYHDAEQKATAEEVIREFEQKHIWNNPIVTEVTPYSNFYPAEDYHQEYFANNPNAGYCRVVIEPKVTKFREKYREKLKR